jgi:hypothetical protein
MQMSMLRRTWMKLLPFAGAAMQGQNRRPPEPPQVVSKEMLQQSLKLAGLEFTDAQLEIMLPSMNRNLPSYDALRKKDVPLDTEPAISFHPIAPPAAPCGFVHGLPSGILFTGHLYQEGAPMRVALALERATDWHKQHPKMDWA